jgi:hypothetical protein
MGAVQHSRGVVAMLVMTIRTTTDAFNSRNGEVRNLMQQDYCETRPPIEAGRWQSGPRDEPMSLVASRSPR